MATGKKVQAKRTTFAVRNPTSEKKGVKPAHGRIKFARKESLGEIGMLIYR